jgi:hypothetical protein
MRLLVAQQLEAGRDQQPDAELVGQRPAGDEHACLVPQQVGHPSLQGVHRGILAVDVIADDGIGHRLAHGRGGGGYGVRAQVDDVHDP